MAQLAWLESPEPGLYPHRLLLERERYFSLPGPRGLLNCSVCNETHLNTAHSKTTPHSHTTPHSPTLLDSWIHSFSTHSQTSQTTLSDLLGLVCTLVLFTAGISLSLFSVGAQASLADLGSRLPEGSAISHSKIKGTHAACGTVPLN